MDVVPPITLECSQLLITNILALITVYVKSVNIFQPRLAPTDGTIAHPDILHF